MGNYICDGSHPYLVGQSCFRTTQLTVAAQSSVDSLRGELRSQISALEKNIESLSSAIDALTVRLNKAEQKPN